MHFLTVNILLTFLRKSFWYYALLLLFLLMPLTYIFLIFYNYLNFCYFAIFGSAKFAVENSITSIFYVPKSVIYLSDMTVSTKELFQIIITRISNSSDCENTIALFLFSFILLFLLLPHKRDFWGWKLVFQQSSYYLAFAIFPQKNPWALSLRIL